MVGFAVLVISLGAYAIASPTKSLIDPRIDLHGSWKVVGGSDAADAAYPFIVSLRSRYNRHFCGGTILNTRWVLTAAHCVVGTSSSNVLVVAGTNTLAYGGTSIAASQLTVHSGYDTSTISDDVAVVQLASALTYSSTIAEVTLNTASTDAVAATLIGWGRTSTGSSLPNRLQQLSTNTITHSACSASWGSFVSSKQICAVIRSGQGACNGDSGGPLIQTSNSAQLGIASFILAGGCAQGFPDVYTRVSSYTSWINNAIGA